MTQAQDACEPTWTSMFLFAAAIFRLFSCDDDGVMMM